jgi:hypothetical protein
VSAFALASAWLLFALGGTNILLGLIFRERGRERRSIFAWRERARDLLPPLSVAGVKVDPVDAAERAAALVREKGWLSRQDTAASSDAEKAGAGAGAPERAFSGKGFGRQGERAAALGG